MKFLKQQMLVNIDIYLSFAFASKERNTCQFLPILDKGGFVVVSSV